MKNIYNDGSTGMVAMSGCRRPYTMSFELWLANTWIERPSDVNDLYKAATFRMSYGTFSVRAVGGKTYILGCRGELVLMLASERAREVFLKIIGDMVDKVSALPNPMALFRDAA